MKIISTTPISFGYKNILKTYFQQGKLPSVRYGFYGGELTKDNVTLEHLLPHSKKGLTKLSNLVLSKDINNWNRGNKPLIQFYDPDIFKKYCSQFDGVKLPFFNGDNYIEQITKTVERLLKQGK